MTHDETTPMYGAFLSVSSTIEFGWLVERLPAGKSPDLDSADGNAIRRFLHEAVMERLDAIGEEPENMDIEWDIILECSLSASVVKDVSGDCEWVMLLRDTMGFSGLIDLLTAATESDGEYIPTISLDVVPDTAGRLNLNLTREEIFGG